jgi:hypothetical protein
LTYARTLGALWLFAFVTATYVAVRLKKKWLKFLMGVVALIAGCYWFFNYFLVVPD